MVVVAPSVETCSFTVTAHCVLTSSYLKFYTTMPVVKLAAFMEVVGRSYWCVNVQSSPLLCLS